MEQQYIANGGVQNVPQIAVQYVYLDFDGELTSYNGEILTVDDVIIGGTGNDSMHGGGGDDIFCFGGYWGNDTIEQLAGGKVTLWFEDGSESCWDAATLTYTDGTNTVRVNGVDAVTLKFGTDASLPDGCFEDAASEKIFEDKNKGMLA